MTILRTNTGATQTSLLTEVIKSQAPPVAKLLANSLGQCLRTSILHARGRGCSIADSTRECFECRCSPGARVKCFAREYTAIVDVVRVNQVGRARQSHRIQIGNAAALPQSGVIRMARSPRQTDRLVPIVDA